jgi:hypothetical protein
VTLSIRDHDPVGDREAFARLRTEILIAIPKVCPKLERISVDARGQDPTLLTETLAKLGALEELSLLSQPQEAGRLVEVASSLGLRKVHLLGDADVAIDLATREIEISFPDPPRPFFAWTNRRIWGLPLSDHRASQAASALRALEAHRPASARIVLPHRARERGGLATRSPGERMNLSSMQAAAAELGIPCSIVAQPGLQPSTKRRPSSPQTSETE